MRLRLESKFWVMGLLLFLIKEIFLKAERIPLKERELKKSKRTLYVCKIH